MSAREANEAVALVAAWCAGLRQVGGVDVAHADYRDVSSAGGDARVHAVVVAGAPVAIVKRHRSVRKYRQEVTALLRFAPALAEAAPQLLAHEDGRLLLLMSVVRGRPLASLPLERAGEEHAHRALGALTARLHRVPHVDADRLPAADAFRRRVDAWCARAAGVVAPSALATVRALASDTAGALDGAARVPCHRDLAPRNVVVEAAGGRAVRVGFVDFEHARPDLPWFDLVRLAVEVWAERPDLEAAFMDGYGAPPHAGGAPGAAWSELDTRILASAVALHGVATLAWGARHGDAALMRSGRAVLARVAPG